MSVAEKIALCKSLEAMAVGMDARLRREAEKRAKEPKKKGHSHDNNQNNNRMNNSMNSTGGMFNNFR